MRAAVEDRDLLQGLEVRLQCGEGETPKCRATDELARDLLHRWMARVLADDASAQRAGCSRDSCPDPS